MRSFADFSITPLSSATDQPRPRYSVGTHSGAAAMIDLNTSDQLIRSDIACMIAILADALACDEDLNESREELV